jgi:hypothetical protein
MIPQPRHIDRPERLLLLLAIRVPGTCLRPVAGTVNGSGP